MASRWLKVLGPDGLPEGALAGVTCEGWALCLSRVDGRVGALEDLCPHQGALLSGGWLNRGELVCPRHAWGFDPVTGLMPGGGEGPRAFAVEERDDGIYVAVDGDPA